MILKTGRGEHRKYQMPPQTPPSPKPISLRVELEGVTPLIWRRIVVPNQWTLASLHHYLQWVMGWQDTDPHSHEFQVGQDLISSVWCLDEMAADPHTPFGVDERRVSIAAMATQLGIGGAFEYRYDMGDGWVHRIVIEVPPVVWRQHDLPMPTCTAGENACPPDNVGGPRGYAHFLRFMADTKHDEHANTLRWIGGVFDPAAFDLNRVNFGWRGAKPPHSARRSSGRKT